MKVILRSESEPDVGIEANEYVRLHRLDQHIRTLQTARRWLMKENRIFRERAAERAKAEKAKQKV